MWLFNSSIGRKFVMSLTGLALIFFLLFHGVMNVVLVFSEPAYNWICRFLGSNWYALVGTVGLGALVFIHFAYALWLTVQNRRARGNDRYAVRAAKPGVDWESENMLVLGLCVLGFLCLHLYHFWFHMQAADVLSKLGLMDISGRIASPEDGAAWVRFTFCCPVLGQICCVLYLLWFCCLFLHIRHGFWSAFHTLGWDNLIWQKRLHVISTIIAALVVLPFAIVVCYYFGLGVGALL